MKRLGVLLLLLDGMLAHRRLSPSICQVSLTVCWQPFILRVERGTVRVKCLAQEHNTMTQPGLEPRPVDPESSELTTRPPHLPLVSVVVGINCVSFLEIIIIYVLARGYPVVSVQCHTVVKQGILNSRNEQQNMYSCQ